MTLRIEPLFLRTFFSIWLTELNWFFPYDWKNWFFSIWLKELIFDNDSKNSMFEKEYWRKDLSLFLEHDAKNWTFPTWLKELNLLSNSLNQRFALCFFSIWLKELKFCQYDWKNWISFFQRWVTELNFLNMTERIELFYDSKELNDFTFFFFKK